MEAKFFATLFILLAVCGGGCYAAGGGADTTLANKCSTALQKVTACLTFATGRAVTPTRECCDAVTDLKASDPACLCVIIQQIHNGSNPTIKQMGVQEARLLQLPSACRLANASVSDCPKLLHLPANSPDSAIFTGNATTSPVATPGTSTPTTGGDSNGFQHRPQQFVGLLAVATTIFFYAFLAGGLI